MHFAEAGKKTKRVVGDFEKNRKRKWTPEVMLTDLAEEVGELSNAILVREGYKSVKRKKANLTDSLCDILFDIFMIADHYGVDLEKEYGKVLKELEARLKRGEFSHPAG